MRIKLHFNIQKQTNEKVKMFSAWVVICIEHLAAIEKNKKVPDNDKRFFSK